MSSSRQSVPGVRSPDALGPKPDIGGWLTKAIESFGDEWLVYCLQGLTCMVMTFLPAAVGYGGFFTVMITHAAEQSQSGQTGGPPPTDMFLWMGVMYGGLLVGLLVGLVLVGGMAHTAGKQLAGRPIRYGDLFGALDRAPALLGLGLVIVLMSVATCGIGFLFVAPLLVHAVPLLTVERVGLGEAMSRSAGAATKHYWWYFLWAFLLNLIASVGQSACLIGYAATLPIATIASVVAYRAAYGLDRDDDGIARTFGD